MIQLAALGRGSQTPHEPRHRMGRSLATAVFVCTLVQACFNETFDTTEESDAILTAFEPTHDFSPQRTYAMPDEVFDLSDLAQDPKERDERFDPLILERIARNMEQLGYERVPLPDPPDPDLGNVDADVVVAVGAVVQENWYWYGFYPCWGYWDCWWYYPPVAVPISYDVGSIAIAMVTPDSGAPFESSDDLAAAPATNPVTFPVVWGSAIRGLARRSSTKSTQARINDSIDQAFDQSPYLRRPITPAGATP